MSEIKVKPLVWDVEKPNWWTAVCPATNLGYEVRVTDRGTVRKRLVGQNWSAFGGTAEQAKALHQEYHRQRILAALQTQDQSDKGGMK